MSEIDTLRNYLIKSGMGKCSCGTKSPNISFHGADCAYVISAQALDHLDAVEETFRDRLTALEAENKALRDGVKELTAYGCPVCGGDCASANPPVTCCPMQTARALLAKGDGK